jgi:predicted GH43/DUF377 family glycosyl hydrolase
MGILKPYGLPVERLFDGAPIIAPTANRWESGVTFNSAAVYLERSPANDPIIAGMLPGWRLTAPELREGVAALHYRARPSSDPGYPWNRSYVGLAVFTPTLQLLHRHAEPIIAPGEQPADCDYLGVEDPRITRIGDDYYAVYCGVADFAEGTDWKAANCLASSRDLLHWTRYGSLRGDVNVASNKDGVLFPGPIDGRYFLLHRPMIGEPSDYAINLAVSDAPDGVWQDCGPILRAMPDPEYCTASWVGAGSVPIPLDGQRYLVIYHTGNRLHSGDREYDLDAAIFDMSRFDPAKPSAVVQKRIDRFMVPETETELRAPFADSVANVLFTCGAYVHRGDLYIVYGGGDTFILAARMPLSLLLDHLERSDARPL